MGKTCGRRASVLEGGRKKHMKKVKHSIEDKVISALIGIFMVVFVVVTLYPVINTVAISFNEGIDAVRGGI